MTSTGVELTRQKGHLPADSVPSAGDETQGSAFLAQVEMLFVIQKLHVASEVGNAISGNYWK